MHSFFMTRQQQIVASFVICTFSEISKPSSTLIAFSMDGNEYMNVL